MIQPNKRKHCQSGVGSEYAVKDHTVPVEGGTIRVRSVVPSGGKDYPLLVWYHASGEFPSLLENCAVFLR